MKDDVTIEISCDGGCDVGSWPVAGIHISGVTSPGFVFNGSLSLPDIDLIPLCNQASIRDKKKLFRHFRFPGGV